MTLCISHCGQVHQKHLTAKYKNPFLYHMNRNSAQFNATHKKQEMQVVYEILRPKTTAVIGTKVDDYRP
jgi:hypothetical protein